MSIFEKLSGKGVEKTHEQRRVPFLGLANMLRLGFLLKVLAACSPTPQELPPTGSIKTPITLGAPLVSAFPKSVNIETNLNGQIVTFGTYYAKLSTVEDVSGKQLPGRTRMTFSNADPNTGIGDIRAAELTIDAKIDPNNAANSSATITVEGINKDGVVDLVPGLADKNVEEYASVEKFGFGRRIEKIIAQVSYNLNGSLVEIIEDKIPRWINDGGKTCGASPISIHPSSKPGLLRVVVDMHYSGYPQRGANIFLADMTKPNWCQDLLDRMAATKDPMAMYTDTMKLKAAGIMDPLSDRDKDELEAPETQDGLLQGVTEYDVVNKVNVTLLYYQGKQMTYNPATQIWTAGGTDQDRTLEEGRLTTILRSNTVSNPNATAYMLVFYRLNQQTQGYILTRAILVSAGVDQMGRQIFQMVKITPTPDVQLPPDYDGDQRRGTADGCPVISNPAENGAGIDTNKDLVDDSCNASGFDPKGPRNPSGLIKVTPELSESGGNKFTNAFATENGSTFQSNQDVKLDQNRAVLAQGGQILRAIHSSPKDPPLKIKVPQGYGLKIQVNSVKHLDGTAGKGELSIHKWDDMMMDPNSVPTQIPFNAPTGLVDYGYVGGQDDVAGVEGSDVYIEIYGPHKAPPWMQPKPDLAEQPKDGGADLMQPPDKDAAPDLAERPDAATLPDLATPEDLASTPDLATTPDATNLPDLTSDECPDGGDITAQLSGGGCGSREKPDLSTPAVDSTMTEAGDGDGCGCKVGGKHEHSTNGPLKALALASLLFMSSPRRRRGIGGMIDRGREALARVLRIG